VNSALRANLVNGRFGDPCLYVDIVWEGRAIVFDLGANDCLAPRRLLKISDAFVSHAHLNHFIGFDNLLRRRLAHAAPLRLYGPPEMGERVAAKLSGYTWNLADAYPFELVVVEMRPDSLRRMGMKVRERFHPVVLDERPLLGCVARILEEPLFTVEATLLDHRIPSAGFALTERLRVNIDREALAKLGLRPGNWLRGLKERIRSGSSDETSLDAGEGRRLPLGELRQAVASVRPGRKLAYVVDAAFTEENIRRVVELARNADVFFCEAAFLHRDLDRARDTYRLTVRQAGWLTRQAGARRLEVFHFSPRYQAEADALCHEADEAFRGLSAPE